MNRIQLRYYQHPSVTCTGRHLHKPIQEAKPYIRVHFQLLTSDLSIDEHLFKLYVNI